MTKFVQRNIVFFSLLFTYFIINFIINKAYTSDLNVRLKNVNSLIVGDSYLQHAINPKKLYKTENTCLAAETYFLTYHKLNHIFSKKKVDTIYIGFSIHNFSEYNDNKMTSILFENMIFDNYQSILNYKKLRSIDFNFSKFYKTVFRRNCLYPRNSNNDYLGSFSKKLNSNISNSETRIKLHYYDSLENILSISDLAISYTDSIIDLCKQNEVTPIFVVTPTHQSYFSKIPDIFVSCFERQKKYLEKRKLLVVDISNISLENSMFLDCNHVNFNGSKKVTNELMKILKKDE